MTMLAVSNYNEILLKSGYIWLVFKQICYFDQDWNIFIFEVELGTFCIFRENIENNSSSENQYNTSVQCFMK